MTSRIRPPLFERLKSALDEGIADARGELTLRTTNVPSPPPAIEGSALADLRKKAGISQAVFARVLNVSPKTLQSWEQGLRRPADAARRLIQVFSEYPEILYQTAGLTPISRAPRKSTRPARIKTHGKP